MWGCEVSASGMKAPWLGTLSTEVATSLWVSVTHFEFSHAPVMPHHFLWLDIKYAGNADLGYTLCFQLLTLGISGNPLPPA